MSNTAPNDRFRDYLSGIDNTGLDSFSNTVTQDDILGFGNIGTNTGLGDIGIDFTTETVSSLKSSDNTGNENSLRSGSNIRANCSFQDLRQTTVVNVLHANE